MLGKASKIVNQIQVISLLKEEAAENTVTKGSQKIVHQVCSWCVSRKAMKQGEVSALPTLLRDVVSELKTFIAKNKDKAVTPKAVDPAELKNLKETESLQRRTSPFGSKTKSRRAV